jgi:hypothetical protein
MILLTLFALLFIAGLLVWKLSWEYEGFGVGLTLVGAMLLFFGILFVIVSVTDPTVANHTRITEYLAIVDARGDKLLSRESRMLLADEISKINNAVVGAKSYNDTLLDIWFSDELAELEPIR